MKSSILQRYHQITPLSGTGVPVEAELQEERIVFRSSSRSLQSQNRACFTLLTVWGALFFLFLQSSRNTRLYVETILMLMLFGLKWFVRRMASQPARPLFTIDTKLNQFIVHEHPEDVCVDLNDIDQFLLWTRKRQSEMETDVRILTHNNRNIVIPLASGEKTARSLGFLCDKPVFQLSPTEALTQLDTQKEMQLLLRPSIAPDTPVELVIPASHPSTDPPEQLLRASNTDTHER